MARTIELRSKATKVFDYRKTDISSFIPAFTPDEGQLEKDIERVLKAHGVKESPAAVAAGDMVTLSLRSGTAKFNKDKIVVMVGKGLYSKELEEKLIGLEKGVSFTVTADGADVSGTVEQIIRTILPELTDESVAGFGMDGIATVTDLKGYCVDKQLDRILDDCEEMDMASAMVWQALSENCEFVLDEEELSRALKIAEERKAEIESREPVFSTEEEEQAFLKEYEEEYGEPYVELDLGEFTKEMAMAELKLGAIGCEAARREGKLLTEEDYDEYIRRYMEALPGATREEVRQKFPMEEYAKQEYNNRICDELDDYVRETFKRKMNPYRREAE